MFDPSTLPDLTELLTDLPELRAALGIVHHVPGRIRLRLGSELMALGERADAAVALGWLHALSGITEVRLNAAAASLVIVYDPARLPPQWWETLILGEDDEAVALVLGLLA